jgi:antitoxin ChpS
MRDGMHTSTLRAVGGSVTVTLPRQMLRTLGLEAGATVGVAIEGDRLVINSQRPRYNLADLVRGMKAGDLPSSPGWEDAAPKGREAW